MATVGRAWSDEEISSSKGSKETCKETCPMRSEQFRGGIYDYVNYEH